MSNPAETQQAPEQRTILQQSSHPVALVFHLLFRVSAIVLYILGGIFNSSVLLFVILVLLLAFDFWTVKNVTGRLLVGLRWWNEVKEDGSNVWYVSLSINQSFRIFESRQNRQVNATDSRIFWWSMYLTPLVWGIFAFMKLFQFYTLDFLISIVAIVLSMANVVGYTKCEKVHFSPSFSPQKDAKKKVQSYLAGNGMVQGMMGNIISNRISSIFG